MGLPDAGREKMLATAAAARYDDAQPTGRRSSSGAATADDRRPRTKGWTEAAVSPFQVVNRSVAARSSGTLN